MSIYTIILSLFALTLVSAQEIPVITGYAHARKLEDSDKADDASTDAALDDEPNDDADDNKVPETQEEAEARIIAAAEKSGTKLPVSLKTIPNLLFV
jgi:hypothetical protein